MRFVPANCLRPGQILGRDLVFDRNRVLLRGGVTLTASLIGKVRMLGFQGVYIDDDLSRSIFLESVISDELRGKAQKEVRTLFVTVETASLQKTKNHFDALLSTVTNIVDEILRNRNLMVNIIDIRAYDDYTYSHSINVAVLSTMLGAVLGMGRQTLHELAMGALVHDLGKVFIDKRIINKESKLTLEEFEEVKRHSLAGYNYLAPSKVIPPEAKTAVLTHHEQYNGNGYPAGLSGEAIHLFGRIIAVVDVYDALVSDRPYRRALLPSDAIEYIMSGYNTLFDPLVVDAFIRKVAPYPVGTCVRLSNDCIGIVVENFENTCLRPKLQLIEDGKTVPRYIDLTHDYNALNITIKEIVNI